MAGPLSSGDWNMPRDRRLDLAIEHLAERIPYGTLLAATNPVALLEEVVRRLDVGAELLTHLKNLVPLATEAMKQAYMEGAGFDVERELEESRRVIAKIEGDKG